jgi:hypothetical protein
MYSKYAVHIRARGSTFGEVLHVSDSVECVDIGYPSLCEKSAVDGFREG